MSFLNLSMEPNGAMMESVVTYSPEQSTDAIKAIENSPSSPLVKIGQKLHPIHEMVISCMKEIPLMYEDPVSAVQNITTIENTAKAIAEAIPMAINKLTSTMHFAKAPSFIYQSMIANAKIFITKRDSIVRMGLSKYKSTRRNKFPVISNFDIHDTTKRLMNVFDVGSSDILNMSNIRSVLASYDQGELEYFESMDDLINVLTALDDRFVRLTDNAEYSCDILEAFRNVTDCDANDDYCNRTYSSTINLYMSYVSRMLRFVSEKGYDLTISIDDGEIDNKYYRETLKQMIASACNAFYIGSLICFSTAFRIEDMLNDKHDMDAHVEKIVSELK